MFTNNFLNRKSCQLLNARSSLMNIWFEFHISSENPVKMKDSSNFLLFKVKRVSQFNSFYINEVNLQTKCTDNILCF